MRVVERYFGPRRDPKLERAYEEARVQLARFDLPPEQFLKKPDVGPDYEGRIKVEVNGRQLEARAVYTAEMVRYSRIPEHVLMRKLEDEIMYEVRKELFGR